MSRRKRFTCFPTLLMVMFGLLGIGILWVGTPIVVGNDFGAPDPALTPFQVRQYGVRLLLARNNLVNAKSPSVNSPQKFLIEEGSSVTVIALEMEDSGIISDGNAFRNYLIYKGLDSQIRAGEYVLLPSMTPIEIAGEIRAGNPIVTLYVYPGWRAEEIGASLSIAGIQLTENDFMRVVKNPNLVVLPGEFQQLDSLEGFLFPGQYDFLRIISAEELVSTMVNRFISEAMPIIVEKQESTKLTLPEIVAMASIIQRESLDVSERPLIASVLYNRLRNGMKLETDPTVQYAVGYSQGTDSWWKKELTLNDLAIDSAFNTYVVYGLPPHPIANPDLDSIRAALFPAETPYFYFRAVCDGSGSHVFSITFEEHLSKACK